MAPRSSDVSSLTLKFHVARDDEGPVTPEQVDRAEEQVDAAACRQEHLDYVHHVWAAGMIAAQGR